MKLIIFDGRIGKDAELKKTMGGKPYVKFSVANNSFVNGQEKNEWFEVTSYDPFIIEQKVKYLTKGTPVQVVGTLNTDVKVKDGKIWVNQYVNADRIEFNFIGRKDGENSDSEYKPSTLTGGTESEKLIKENQQKIAQEEKETKVPMPSIESTDDELPF